MTHPANPNLNPLAVIIVSFALSATLARCQPPCGTIAHFKPGVNLDGWTGGATFQEQDQSVALMKIAGVQLVRINTPWHALEPAQKGTYDTNLLAFYDH